MWFKPFGEWKGLCHLGWVIEETVWVHGVIRKEILIFWGSNWLSFCCKIYLIFNVLNKTHKPLKCGKRLLAVIMISTLLIENKMYMINSKSYVYDITRMWYGRL